MSEHRLGLALSGGGFRASLFHLGALRRLAELGLLRHVTHISTVSGGSIVAAHYYLHFKRAYEQQEGQLDRDDYINIVNAVEHEFTRGIDQDVRNTLLLNPLSHLEEFTLGNGYGRRMARLYTKHFYGGVIRDLFAKAEKKEREEYRKRGVPLHRVIVRRPGVEEFRSSSYPNSAEPERTLIEFNTEEQQLANIPALVMNSTCLNTGGPFLFTLNEVGGTECGYVRTDEVFMLLQFKYLLETLGSAPFDDAAFGRTVDVALTYGRLLEAERRKLPQTALKSRDALPPHLRDHLCLYLAAKARKQRRRVEGDTWVPYDQLFAATNGLVRVLMEGSYWPSIRHLMEASFGTLRRAKIAAWHLLDHVGWTTERRGGLTREDYEHDFYRALLEIDDTLAYDFARDGQFDERLLSLVLDFYYFRSAEVLEWGAYAALHDISIAEAVAASANFPPMFTPFKIFGLFEERHVSALSLTDGGVHDNQGIESLLDAGCSHVIVSDAGGLVRHEETAADSRLPMMDRVIDVLMGGVRRVLMRSVRETCHVSDLLRRAGELDEEFAELRRATHLQKAAVIHMTSNPSDTRVKSLEPFAAVEVAALRTDLDVFNELEIAALRHQGYQLADRYSRDIREALGETSEAPPAVRPSPELPAIPTLEQLRVLRAGSRRMTRYSAAYPLRAAMIAVAVACVALLLTTGAFVKPNGHWSSWSSIRDLLDDNVIEWMSNDHRTPNQVLLERQLWQDLVRWRKDLLDVAATTSLITVVFALWACWLMIRFLVSESGVARNVLKTDLKKLVGRRRGVAIFKRGWNILSFICIGFFIFTLNVKWLVGIVQLWSVPLALVFLVVHVVFTPLWRRVGRLRDPGQLLSLSRQRSAT